LLGKIFYRLLHVDLGFSRPPATLDIALPPTQYPTEDRMAAAARQIIDRVSSCQQ